VRGGLGSGGGPLLGDGRRLDHSDRLWLRLGCGNRFGDNGRLDTFHDGLRLRLDLGGLGRCLLRSCLLRRCGRGVGVGRRGRLCRRSLLRSGLLGRLDFLWLLRTGQTITKCATFEPIGLCLDQGARVGLHTHTHGVAQRHHFGVGHSELLGELVHAHVFRQNQFSLSLASACRSLFRRPLILSCW
jgi:hypothetical protein